jgi:cell division inhibitor SepF
MIPTEVGVAQSGASDWLDSAGHDVQDDDVAAGGLAAGAGKQIAVVRVRNFRDAATIGEYYRQGLPVVINLEDMDHAAATRIVDFISGLILGLRGDLERVSRRTFLIVPPGAAIITRHDGVTEKGFFNQA